MKPEIKTDVWWDSSGPDNKAHVLDHSQSTGRSSDLELMTLPFHDLPGQVRRFIKLYHDGAWS